MRARPELLAAFAVALLLTGGSPDAPPPATAQDPKVGKILDEWQRRSAERKNLDVRFTQENRSPSWNESMLFRGRLALMRDGRANLVFSTVAPEGKSFPHERILWSGESLHQVDYSSKQHFIFPIPEGERGKLPAILALPFCWNATADGIRALYRAELVKETPKAWLVSFTPLKTDQSPYFSKAYLQLNRETYLPDRYVLISPNGKDTQDYSVTGIRSDGPIAEADLYIPDDKEFRLIQAGGGPNDTGLQALMAKLFPIPKFEFIR